MSRGLSFDKIMDGLKGAAHSYAPDLPGSGASENPGFKKPDFMAFAVFLRQFCTQLGISEAVLAGDSMGGGIVIAMAATYPDLVKKIVLFDSVSYNIKPSLSMRISLMPVIGPFIFRKLYNWEMFSSFIYKDVYEDPSGIDREELLENYRLFDTPSRRSFTYRLVKAVTDSSQVESMIPGVKVPALIIWGGKDRLVPPSNAVRLAKDLKDSRLVIIPGAGHAAFDERPEIVIEAMKEFLK